MSEGFGHEIGTPMFNMSFGEMLILGALALIFIGPKQLPEVARVVGRFLNEMRRATDGLTGEFIKSRDSIMKTESNSKPNTATEAPKQTATETSPPTNETQA